ncbi:MAG: homoserine O-acetyltransferase [Tepidisphaeraceae bacterium]|jgi:homoserine O-acetyltransferase
MNEAEAADKAIFQSSDSLRSAAALPYAQSVTFAQPLKLELGAQLPQVTVAYETYGTLDSARSNAVLICHALSGDSHVARHDPADSPGWWDIAVGPGKAIDTDRFFVICPNILGGCRGTTGPNSINPATQRRYAAAFPTATIGDTIEVHRRLLDHLGIERLHAVVGGSMGGQQAMLWATRYPQRIQSCVLIATAARLSSQALAFDVVARNAILRDPNYHGGNYYDRPPGPAVGLAIARMLGHITYLSQEAMTAKFDPSRLRPTQVQTAFEKRFSVGAYLAHQGDKFVERFDANSYVTLSLMMDLFDLGHPHADLSEAFAPATCRWLVISYSSDWLFPPEQSEQIVNALIAKDKPASSCEVQTSAGHDAFLLSDSLDVYGGLIRAFLAGTDAATSPEPQEPPTPDPSLPLPIFHGNRPDHSAILGLIPPGKSVLDLGCGNGELLSRLAQAGGGRSVGVELEPQAIISCLQRGLDVVHADVGKSLAGFRHHQFDVVVLSQALQCIADTERILNEIVRIGRLAIVSFPNFAYRRLREMFWRDGRSPKMEGSFGFEWYDTPNRRFASILDVEDLCHRLGISIVRKVCLNSEERRFVEDDPNRNATEAIFVLVRDKT